MRASLLLVVVVLGLSACGGGGSGTAGNPAQGGTPRAFTRNDSAVTSAPNTSGGFTATQVVTLSNDDAGAANAVVSLSDENGNVTSSPSSSGYQIQVTLTADAPTDAQAREALATMTVSHRDATGSNTLYLDNAVQFAPYSANGVNRNATVAAALPATQLDQLYEHTVNGNSASSGLHGPGAQIETTNGTVTVSGMWDWAAAKSSSGTVTVSGDVAALYASSDNGNVQATLPCVRNTQASLDSTNGSIDATVTQTAGAGYDLDAQTTNGTAAIVVTGTQPVGTQSNSHAHDTSPNYASSNPQISVSAATVNGNALIHE